MMALTTKRVLFSLLRVWLGIQWLEAGLHKVGAPAWTGENAGAAVAGFAKGAIAKATGENPAVQSWFADFLGGAVVPNATLFSYMVAWGEVLAGVGLILGVFTGFAAVGAAMMNMMFMLAGTTSTNPILYTAAIVVLAGISYAQYFGVDAIVRPKVEHVAEEGVKRMRGRLTKSHA